MSIRLNKLLSSRGIGARRKCDTIIAEGRVRVNGRVVSEPGTTVEEQRDRVEVDGRPLPRPSKHAYFVINKPVGVITTMSDPQGRRTIAELLPRGQRLYPVGRLDADTSGLLLLTNDGELAHKLMHPRYGVDKVYRVRLANEPGRHQLERLARGVEYEPGHVSAPARARRIDPGFDAIMIEVILHEGRHRQVRRMCEAVGLVVTGLHRVGYGPIRLGQIARGMWRELSEEEVAGLQAAAARPLQRGGPASRPARPGRPSRPSRPAPAPPEARRERERPESDEDEIEETWVPGGGTLTPFEEDEAPASEWPARSGRARGDDAFRESGERPARPAARALPWHAPEYRRGPKSAPRRDDSPRESRERAPRPTGRPERRERPGAPPRGPRARFESPRRDSGAPTRGPRSRFDSPRRESGPPTGGPRSRFESPRRDSGGPPRGDRREGRSADSRGRTRPGERPARAGEGRAFSPRPGGRPGNQRPTQRRGRTEDTRRGEKRGSAGDQRRPRKR